MSSKPRSPAQRSVDGSCASRTTPSVSKVALSHFHPSDGSKRPIPSPSGLLARTVVVPGPRGAWWKRSAKSMISWRFMAMIRRRFRSCSGIYLSVISGTHGNAPGPAGRRGSISISSGRPFHLVDLDHRHPVPEGLKLRNRALRTLASNGPCQQQFLHRLEAFHQTAGHHPVVVADPFQSMAARVVKPTDFQSAAGFRENPLYREVDRHLESRDQIAFTPSHLPDRKVLLTLKRSRGDFSRAAEEAPHFTGSCLDGIARAIEEGRGLGAAWREIRRFVGHRTGTGDFDSLDHADLGLLRDVRRDTVDRSPGRDPRETGAGEQPATAERAGRTAGRQPAPAENPGLTPARVGGPCPGGCPPERPPGRTCRPGAAHHQFLPTPIVHENPSSSTSALVTPVRTSMSPA